MVTAGQKILNRTDL